MPRSNGLSVPGYPESIAPPKRRPLVLLKLMQAITAVPRKKSWLVYLAAMLHVSREDVHKCKACRWWANLASICALLLPSALWFSALASVLWDCAPTKACPAHLEIVLVVCELDQHRGRCCCL
eukprot:803044-Pelagomonas_calceolata.AAC.4